jgi:hypothetical protein
MAIHIHIKDHKSMSKDKNVASPKRKWLQNQFDLEIKGHMKVVMLPHPPSDSSTPSSQI